MGLQSFLLGFWIRLWIRLWPIGVFMELKQLPSFEHWQLGLLRWFWSRIPFRFPKLISRTRKPFNKLQLTNGPHTHGPRASNSHEYTPFHQFSERLARRIRWPQFECEFVI